MKYKKKCTKCKKIKSVNDFNKLKKGRYGVRSWCKKCQKEYNKEFYKNNPQYMKEYYENNVEKVNEKAKKYKKNHPEKMKEIQKRWRKNNPNCLKKWQKNNPEKYKKIYRRANKKYQSITINRLSGSISAQIRHSLKANKNGRHWENLVNFTLQELIIYLEKLFKLGMTWNNYGAWHIDHIRPISSFNFISYEDIEFKECWNLNNLQPLWASENMSKGNRY